MNGFIIKPIGMVPVIFYRLYNQDGVFVHMTMADTPSNRKLAEWIRIHDRYTVTERI